MPCNETAVYGSDENIIFMRYVEKLHLDKYSVKNTVKTETMAIQLAEIYVRYRYGERIAEEEKPNTKARAKGFAILALLVGAGIIGFISYEKLFGSRYV